MYSLEVRELQKFPTGDVIGLHLILITFDLKRAAADKVFLNEPFIYALNFLTEISRRLFLGDSFLDACRLEIRLYRQDAFCFKSC